MIAARTGHVSVLTVLIRAGASLDLQELINERTALHKAALKGAGQCAEVLLAAGASTEIQDKHGRVAAQYAEVKGFAGIVRAIRQVGCFPNICKNTFHRLCWKSSYSNYCTAL